MTITNWKITFRNLWKHRVYSSINVIGLTLGLAAFILIALFIRYEISWDKHNENYERIYRVQRHFTHAKHAIDGNDISPHTRPITAQLLENHYPEFEKITVVKGNSGKFLSIDADRQIYDDKGIHADENIFNIFTYRFLEGTQDMALQEPFAIVLSQTMASKLFPDKSAMGEKVVLEKKYNLKVTGVYADLPENSSLRPSYIVSFSTLATTNNITRESLWADGMTYALLKPNTDYKYLENRIKDAFAGYRTIEYEKLLLCPLSKVYLSYNGNMDYIIILGLFALIGLFILVMSAFNYISLTTANSSMRGKEVAIKKSCGSSKSSLVFQFMAETILISLLALLLALVLTKLSLPLFSMIVDKPITLDFVEQSGFIWLMVSVTLVVGVLTGIYPAFFLSSYPILSTVKGQRKGGHDKIGIKKVLVAVQFAISIFLILTSLSLFLQIKHMTEKDLGFEKENILYAEIAVTKSGVSFDQLRNRLLMYPEILDGSMSENLPFVSFGGGMINWEGGNQDEKINCRFNKVSPDFVQNMGITIVQGRDFSREYSGDVGTACLINEVAAQAFGWENPIGKRLDNNRLTVVGVVNNYVYKDIHNKIEPAVLVLAPDEVSGDRIFAFKVDSENPSKAKTILNKEFAEAFPNDPFEFQKLAWTFLNENTFSVYHSISRTILFFTIMNIGLAIFGLMGLVSFTVSRRTKEIAVRKINGSTPLNIFYLLSREYFILLGIAVVIAFPGAYSFYSTMPGAFKLPPQLWIYALGTGIILTIILLTTSYQTIKAATRNPVESLRYE